MSDGSSSVSDQGAIMDGLDTAPAIINPTAADDAAPESPKAQMATTSTNISTMASSSTSQSVMPDVLSNEMQSLQLHANDNGAAAAGIGFLLMDNEESLKVDSAEELARRLGCDHDAQLCKIKVVAILGNSGEGKSYALNHSLFEGNEVFVTSADQRSCTLGVWAAYQPLMRAMVLDTEGIMGNGADPDEILRKRMLLKVLAVADVVVLCTKAERIPNDLLLFLGDASKTYNEHFSLELRRVHQETHGPSLVICHETRYSEVLPSEDDDGKSPETVVRDRLTGLDQDISAFSKITYVGAKADNSDPSALLERLKEAVVIDLEESSTRQPRSVGVVYETLQALTTNFKGDVSRSNHRSFADEYFTCGMQCSSCDAKCEANVNHGQGLPHRSASRCVYRRSFENKRLFCTRCHQIGFRVEVVHKSSAAKDSAFSAALNYVWSGNVLECSNCGVIFRDREKWQGNLDPERAGVVTPEVTHIWPGQRSIQGTHNAARRVLDSVNNFSGAVSTISAAPSASVRMWMADQCRPDYWRPNKEITRCYTCKNKFEETQSPHHCRACGEGFCGECSRFKRPCVERGWGQEPQRSCKKCYDEYNNNGIATSVTSEKNDIQARKVTEKVSDTLSGFTSIFSGPISAVKDLARPAYWIPDEDILSCYVCGRDFAPPAAISPVVVAAVATPPSPAVAPISKHHCRKCGNGVCDPCSKTNMPVPDRGWDSAVRVCDKCVEASIHDAATS